MQVSSTPKKHAYAPSILCMFETTSGLGHQRRSSGIANALSRAGADVRVASGTFVNSHVFFDPNIELVKLPKHRIWKDGEWLVYNKDNKRVSDKNFDESKWRQARNEVIRDAVINHPPHAVLVEFWPFSRRREFTQVVNTILENCPYGHRPLVFSSARDILDTARSQKKSKKQVRDDQQRASKLIAEKVDHVLVHGDPNFISFDQGFAFYNDIASKVEYTGYVVNPNALPKEEDSREKLVIVSVGSGSTGADMLKSVIAAHPHTNLQDHKWMIVTGPRMEKDARKDVVEILRDYKRSAEGKLDDLIELHEDRPDLPELFRRAAFSISLAGYNTTLETLTTSVPHLLLPKFQFRKHAKPWVDKEQWGRLEHLKNKNMARVLSPEQAADPKKFAAHINAAFMASVPASSLDTDGAAHTAEYVLQKIQDRFGLLEPQDETPEIKAA